MREAIVYGKRARARGVDSFAALAESSSPDHPIKTRKCQEDKQDDLVESMLKCKIDDPRRKKQRPRKALLETCGNKPSPQQIPTRHRETNKSAVTTIENQEDVVAESPEETTQPTFTSQKAHVVENGSFQVTQPRRSPRRKQPIIEQSEVLSPTPVADVYEQHCRPLLCLSQHGISAFDEWSEQLSEHFTITKIAEASFGEVYRLSLQNEFDDLSTGDESVFKVIALRPPPSILPTDKRKRAAAIKKADAMSKVEDVANEVLLLQRMSFIPGFTNFRDLRILKGRPPPAFISAFRTFNAAQKAKAKEPSVFPDPAKKTSYNSDQLWTIIEMQDAGTDLERLLENRECTSIYSIWDIFWQVTLALAKGEEGAEFEHRDLHLGNICVRQPPSPLPIDDTKKLNITGLETTIIDYTISRCTIPSSSSSSSSSADNTAEGEAEIAYHDLSPPSELFLFEADSTNEYQYEIYRYMRSAVFHSNPLAEFGPTTSRNEMGGGRRTRRSWKDFHPLTNAVWLHFILYKLMEGFDDDERTKSMGQGRGKRGKREKELEGILRVVQEVVAPEVLGMDGRLGSASDLVRVALEEGWLGLGDVVGEEVVIEEVDEGELVDAVRGLNIENAEVTPRRSPRKSRKTTEL